MKLPPKAAAKTTAFFERHIAPGHLFFAVLISFPAFLFQRHTGILGAEVLLFFVLCLLRRGRAALLSPLLILGGVAFFNLFTPYGKILFRIGTFTVTEGALSQGLRRGQILVGMLFLSQFSLSATLTLPGNAGKFLAELFAAFNRLTAKKIPLNPRYILAAIDDRLYESYFEFSGETSPASNKSPGSPALLPFYSLFSILYSLFFVLLLYAALIFSSLY
ncbi:MAG: hypothetical protein LBS97_01530 [Treponema sp.]|jgi:energy-coupling factor transporter transmembrane protein EcfT|nr:hypothetical protein [Treponema sp.]